MWGLQDIIRNTVLLGYRYRTMHCAWYASHILNMKMNGFLMTLVNKIRTYMYFDMTINGRGKCKCANKQALWRQ